MAQLATQGLSFLCVGILLDAGRTICSYPHIIRYPQASLIRPYAQASIIANVCNLFQTMSAGFLLVDVPDYLEWVK